MSRTRQQIVFRIREIRTNLEQEEARPSAPEQPPSYEESQRDKIIEKAFDEIASDTNMAAVADVEMGEVSALPSDAEILFTIAGRVQIFYIKVDGSVSAPSYPSTLHLFRFKSRLPHAKTRQILFHDLHFQTRFLITMKKCRHFSRWARGFTL